LSRTTRRNGTLYLLRFFGLDDLEGFLAVLAVFVDFADFVDLVDFFDVALFVDLADLVAFTILAALPAFVRVAARTGRFFLPTAFRLELVRLDTAGRFGRAAVRDAAGARPLRTADRWASANRTCSPNQLYAQISFTEIWRLTHRRFAVSTAEAGMYR